jgi:hypothetical protein
MAVSSFSMVLTESAAVFGSCANDAVIIESEEAGFMVLGPWALSPVAGCLVATVVLAGGIVLPPQYKRAINIIATASVM